MVLASGRIGRTILSVPAPLPLPELPEDVIQVIFERSSSFQVSKVSREWNGIHRKRMQKAKKWVMWVLRYMTCVSYFVNATFILLGKDGVKIEILINSMLNYTTKFEFKVQGLSVFEFKKKQWAIKRKGIKLQSILPKELSITLNDVLLELVSIELDISQKVARQTAFEDWKSHITTHQYIPFPEYDMSHLSISKVIKPTI